MTAPDGLVFFGWHGYSSGSLSATAVDSAAHYAPAEQGDRPWEAICGARRKARGSRIDRPLQVERDVERGLRTICKRCIAKAAAQ